MMKMTKKTHACALLIALTFFTLLNGFYLNNAYAESLKMRTSPTGIHYITGGIGEEDATLMRRHAKQFSLNLLFSEGSNGGWIADINVNIYNDKNVLIFRKVAAKPMLYVNLPAGTYMVLANHNGEKLRHQFTLSGSSNQKIILNWKDSLEDATEKALPVAGE